MNSETIIELAKQLGSLTEHSEIIRTVTNTSIKLLNAETSLILLINPSTRETVKTIIKNGKYIDQKEYYVAHTQIGGWIVKTCKPFFSQNIHNDKRFIKGLFKKVKMQSAAGVPLLIENIIIGALILLFEKPQKDDEHILSTLENIAAISVPFLRKVSMSTDYFSILSYEPLIQKFKELGMIGKSLNYREMLKTVEAAADSDVRVLLNGKSGTGKELIAKAIHKLSPRSNDPFVPVDCGAIPNDLLESEFFGHVEGAFTGAKKKRKGLFLEAENGTLFLDEINNLPFDMQSKLLRVLQEGEIRPVGGDQFIKTNVRVISASSIPLNDLVKNKLFRQDLFFRLNVFPINIPDLSERKEDIPKLANQFLMKFAKQQNKMAEHFHEELLDFIKFNHWEGNIRELENFVERIVTIQPKEEKVIQLKILPTDYKEKYDEFITNQNYRKLAKPLKSRLDDIEADIIYKALIECGWNQSEAARKLSTSEKNIRYKIEKLNIQKPRIQ